MELFFSERRATQGGVGDKVEGKRRVTDTVMELGGA